MSKNTKKELNKINKKKNYKKRKKSFNNLQKKKNNINIGKEMDKCMHQTLNAMCVKACACGVAA